MPSVFFIKGKVRPCLERSVFVHSRYDKAEVVKNGFLVREQYASTSSLVVTPHGKKFDRKIVTIIAYQFDDKG